MWKRAGVTTIFIEGSTSGSACMGQSRQISPVRTERPVVRGTGSAGLVARLDCADGP